MNICKYDEPDIIRAEVAAGIKHLGNGKAPEQDKITGEIIKALGETGIDLLRKLYQNIWLTGI